MSSHARTLCLSLLLPLACDSVPNEENGPGAADAGGKADDAQTQLQNIEIGRDDADRAVVTFAGQSQCTLYGATDAVVDGLPDAIVLDGESRAREDIDAALWNPHPWFDVVTFVTEARGVPELEFQLIMSGETVASRARVRVPLGVTTTVDFGFRDILMRAECVAVSGEEDPAIGEDERPLDGTSGDDAVILFGVSRCQASDIDDAPFALEVSGGRLAWFSDPELGGGSIEANRRYKMLGSQVRPGTDGALGVTVVVPGSAPVEIINDLQAFEGVISPMDGIRLACD